ncbi:MAG: T9SS C-terminal target domain-containing protein [Bacteroidetes bacterium]|nr:MAG: T9SS C-terminal target domain-containing protein [Bacteroidota bacterium]
MKSLFIGLGCLMLAGSLHAQQLVGSAGQSATSPQVQLSYSLGEPVIATLGGNVILTQGFQQVEGSATSVRPPALKGLGLYPNPVTDWLTLELPDPGFYRLRLFALTGQALIDQPIQSLTPYRLSLAQLPAGVYTLMLDQRATGARASVPVLRQ